jgi:hypothetical protein
MSWSRLMSLQRLQDTDLLYRVLERQQRLAKERFGTGDTSSTDSGGSATPVNDEAAPDSVQSSVVSTTSSQG